MSEDEIFVRHLVEVVPSLRSRLDEHRSYYDEVLSHVFFADMSRWAVATCLSEPSSLDLVAFLDFLDAGSRTGGPDTRALIDQSFIENICGEVDIVSRLPSRLSERYSAICGDFESTSGSKPQR